MKIAKPPPQVRANVCEGHGQNEATMKEVLIVLALCALVVSDNAWFYVIITTPDSIPLAFDKETCLREIRRMKIHVTNPNLIIPGHDALVRERFPLVAKEVVRTH